MGGSAIQPELAQGDGRLYVARGGDSHLEAFTWHNATRSFSQAATEPPTQPGIRWVRAGVTSEPRNDDVVAALSAGVSQGLLEVLSWRGDDWQIDWSAPLPATQLDTRGFDLAFFPNGDVMVVYSTGDRTPRFRMRTGGVWSAQQQLPINDDAGPNPDVNYLRVSWVQLAVHPSENEMALVYSDEAAALVGLVWRDGAWVAESAETLEFALHRNPLTGRVLNRAFDVAYEQQSGDVLAAWARAGHFGFFFSELASGDDEWTNPKHEKDAPKDGTPSYIDLSAKPGGDEIAAVAVDVGGGTERLGLAIWEGDDPFIAAKEYDSQIRDLNDMAQGHAPGSVAWAGDTALAVYVDELVSEFVHATWEGMGDWQLQAPVSTQNGAFIDSLQLTPLADDRAHAFALDESGQLLWGVYDASAASFLAGGGILIDDVKPSGSVPFDFVVKD